MILKDPVEAFENPVLSIGWSTELGAVLGETAGGIRATTEECNLWLAHYESLATQRQTGKVANELWNTAHMLNYSCPAEYHRPNTVG